MTRRTQSHEIALVMCPAFGERYDVVNFLCGSDSPGFLALFTQRMLGDVPVADTFPRSTVAFACSGVASVSFILLCVLLGMSRAEPSVRQLGTAGMTTGAFWFIWHRAFSFQGITKGRPGNRERPRAIFYNTSIAQLKAKIPSEFPHLSSVQ